MTGELPLTEILVVLRDGALHRDRAARLSAVTTLRLTGANGQDYVARVARIGGDGRTEVYREVGARRRG